MEDTIRLRISLLGDAGVGKTSLIERFSKGTFDHSTYPTMLDFTNVRVQVEADVVELTILDNAGVERYSQMQRSLNQRADGFILVYDVTNKSSFVNLDRWLKNIGEQCEENAQIFVVGNKVDKHYYDREVSNEDIVNYAKGKEAVFMETSALDDFNINEVFFRAIKMILKSQGLFLPGCEDPFMKHKDRVSHPPPKDDLKKVLVPRKKKNENTVTMGSTAPSPPPAKSSCC